MRISRGRCIEQEIAILHFLKKTIYRHLSCGMPQTERNDRLNAENNRSAALFAQALKKVII
jgi:hypothetical protein